MISIVVNCDTRPGCWDEENTTGDYGAGSLHGVRSWDFLTDGVINKLNFFRGYECELILFIDQHDELPDSIRETIDQITRNLQAKVVCRYNQRRTLRWNEELYLDALRLATGNYVVHFDGDCAAFAHPDKREEVVESMVRMLDSGLVKFVCQPTTLSFAEHGMTWASTRFFMCRREALDMAELELCVHNESYRVGKYGHTPALEHVLGAIAGLGGVFYPPANWDEYMIFSWSRYHRELLHMLNGLPYEKVRDYILSCGIHGPNDVISKGLP